MTKSIMQDGRHCYMTGRTEGLEQHHCIGGINRRLADEDGLWVYLHSEQHWRLHHDMNGSALKKHLQKEAQRAYEKNHTRQEFMDRYGRNYLED